MNVKEQLQRLVTDFYVTSGDFNGISLSQLAAQAGSPDAALRQMIDELVRQGALELMFASHSDNPHIRRVPTLPVEEQVRRLETEDLHGICAYPQREAIAAATDVSAYDNRPYTKRLLLGEAQLAPVFFELSVLERYFEDPRYVVEFHDRSGSISVASEHYQSGTLAPRDEVVLETFGIGYDANRSRVVAAFLRYLTRLSPEHQRVWQTYEVSGPCTMNNDYERAGIWGQWPRSHSVYEAFIAEQVEINRLAEMLGRRRLFKETYEGSRPAGFRPMLRPTAKYLRGFAQTLDKMLSENIDPEFFGADIEREERVKAKDGSIERRSLGSLTLLERWLKKSYRTYDGQDISKEAVASFRKVRTVRSKTSHRLEENRYDPTFPKQQDDLLGEVTLALRRLRYVLNAHPRARDRYVAPAWLDGDAIVFY